MPNRPGRRSVASTMEEPGVPGGVVLAAAGQVALPSRLAAAEMQDGFA
jgi:hypothetical protein